MRKKEGYMVEERRERREELGKDQRRMGGHREVEEERKRNSMEELFVCLRHHRPMGGKGVGSG